MVMGSLSVFIKSLEQIGKEYKLSIDYTFTKVQDIHNLSLLQKKIFFSQYRRYI